MTFLLCNFIRVTIFEKLSIYQLNQPWKCFRFSLKFHVDVIIQQDIYFENKNDFSGNVFTNSYSCNSKVLNCLQIHKRLSLFGICCLIFVCRVWRYILRFRPIHLTVARWVQEQRMHDGNGPWRDDWQCVNHCCQKFQIHPKMDWELSFLWSKELGRQLCNNGNETYRKISCSSSAT